jgi:hypothetical protein
LVDATADDGGRVPYLAVELADAVDPRILGDLAATLAVFEREGDLLRRSKRRAANGSTTTCSPSPIPGQDQRAADPGLLNVTLASTDLPTGPAGPCSTRWPVGGRRSAGR